jgi:hypothetical protein
MAGNGVPGPGNPFGFGMPQPAAAAAAPADNPAAQEGFNPPRPFLDPIQPWIEQHKRELSDRSVHPYGRPVGPMTVTTTQVVVLGLLKRVTDLERQTDNLDRAIMQMRNPNARGGRRTYRRTRRHMRTI